MRRAAGRVGVPANDGAAPGNCAGARETAAALASTGQELGREHHRVELEARRKADGQHDRLTLRPAHLQAVAGRQRHAGDARGGSRRRRRGTSLRHLVAQLVDAPVDLADTAVDGTSERECPTEQTESIRRRFISVHASSAAPPKWIPRRGYPECGRHGPHPGCRSAYFLTTRSARACTGPATPFASVNCSTSTKRPGLSPLVSRVTLMRCPAFVKVTRLVSLRAPGAAQDEDLELARLTRHELRRERLLAHELACEVAADLRGDRGGHADLGAVGGDVAGGIGDRDDGGVRAELGVDVRDRRTEVILGLGQPVLVAEIDLDPREPLVSSPAPVTKTARLPRATV